jgi:hypothetical protein
MTYFIWNKEVSVVEAVKHCGSVKKFLELKARAKRNACRETAIYINGKTISFVR